MRPGSYEYHQLRFLMSDMPHTWDHVDRELLPHLDLRILNWPPAKSTHSSPGPRNSKGLLVVGLGTALGYSTS